MKDAKLIPKKVKAVGRRIAVLRNKKGLNQKELGSKVKRNEHTISRIERGIHAPSLELCFDIGKALEVEISELLLPAKKGKNKEVRRYSQKLWIELRQLPLG